VGHQEDVGVHKAEVAAGGVLEATVAVEALEVVVAQVGSVVVVAVAEGSGEVVVVFEGHEIVSVYLRHGFAYRRSLHHKHKGSRFRRGMNLSRKMKASHGVRALARGHAVCDPYHTKVRTRRK
jgi:hypothetical protein